MNQEKMEAMSVDALFELYGEVSAVLEQRIKDELDRLQNIFESLESAPDLVPPQVAKRRQYPKVQPKFQNPERPDETWAGRGTTPHWVAELVQAGKNIEDFRIACARETSPA